MQKEGKVMALFITFILSLLFLIGVMLGSIKKENERIESVSVAIAFGSMGAVAAFDIIPELIEGIEEGEIFLWKALLFVLLGFFSLLILDTFVPEHEGSEKTRDGNLVHIGIMATLAIAIHNIVEGMSVYSIALTNIKSGALLAVGVALHNIPMGMLVYSTTKSEKRGKKWVTILIASFSTFLGGALMMALESKLSISVVDCLSSIALGMVIYILLFELLGDIIHTKRKLYSLIWIVVGVAVTLLGGIFE